MSELPGFDYPWPGLEDFLTRRSARRLRLLAYGSLMNRASAALTLTPGGEQRPLAVVGAGIRRLFNCRMDASAFARHGNPLTAKHVAALNVVSTGDPRDRVNGVMQAVSLEDLDRFRLRESGYRLAHVQVAEWTTGELIDGPVYVLELAEPCDEIWPHQGYVEVCTAGARSISRNFLEFFCETTYLWDNQTTLSAWLKRSDSSGT